MVNGLLEVERVKVSPEVLRSTNNVLHDIGQRGHEALVLWAGNVSGPLASVTRAIFPEQRPLRNEEGIGYFVHPEALCRVNQFLSQEGLRLIAQVHSHPSEAFHSDADDRY